MLAATLIAVLAWLAADPGAHEVLHHEAGSAETAGEHHCIVFDFTAGVTDLVLFTAGFITALSRVAFTRPIAAAEVRRIAICWRLLGHGPPAAV